MLIELSRKTGLPRGVLPEKEKKEKGASFFSGDEAALYGCASDGICLGLDETWSDEGFAYAGISLQPRVPMWERPGLGRRPRRRRRPGRQPSRHQGLDM